MLRRLLLATALSILPWTAEAADVVETLEAEGFSTFARLIKGVEFNYQLSEKGPFTILAPTEEAIAAQLSAEELTALQQPESLYRLFSILQYHVLPGHYTVAELQELEMVHALSGFAVVMFHFKDRFQILNAQVAGEAIEADNGIVIPIDKVFVQGAMQ